MNVDQQKYQLGTVHSNSSYCELHLPRESQNRMFAYNTEQSSWNKTTQTLVDSNHQQKQLFKPHDMVFSGQELFLKKLNESVKADLLTSSNSNIQNYTPKLNFEDLESMIGINGCILDSCDPISVFYEPYSEKHLSLSFPIPYCVLNETLESLSIKNINVNIESKITKEEIVNENDRSEKLKISPTLLYKPSKGSSQSNRLNSVVEEKVQKKVRKNSNMKKSLATQFQFHHFHDTCTLQNSPSPTSVTDGKGIFLHYQDKHNLQTQQTGNSGTLSKWKYK